MQIKRFRKVTIVSLTTMLLILTLLMTMTPLTVAESGDTLFAPRLCFSDYDASYLDTSDDDDSINCC